VCRTRYAHLSSSWAWKRTPGLAFVVIIETWKPFGSGPRFVSGSTDLIRGGASMRYDRCTWPSQTKLETEKK
jgi:hypothetical protein